MGEMKRLSEIIDDMFSEIIDDMHRPLCPTCGLIPKKDENTRYCFYCDMTADWCQCDVADMCKCNKEGVGKSMTSPDMREEVRDLLWENHYTLATTAVQAMEILWDDYDNIVKWIVDEHGLTEVDYLIILGELTKFVGSLSAEDRHKPAIQVYREWER